MTERLSLTHLFPIPPLQADTEPLFEFPETNSKFLLAISFTYGNIFFFHRESSVSLDLRAADSRISLCRSLDAPVARQ